MELVLRCVPGLLRQLVVGPPPTLGELAGDIHLRSTVHVMPATLVWESPAYYEPLRRNLADVVDELLLVLSWNVFADVRKESPMPITIERMIQSLL